MNITDTAVAIYTNLGNALSKHDSLAVLSNMNHLQFYPESLYQAHELIHGNAPVNLLGMVGLEVNVLDLAGNEIPCIGPLGDRPMPTSGE